MPSDPRDYKLDLTDRNVAGAVAPPALQPTARPFVSVDFACCGVYQRVYRDASGKDYLGRCPRCGRSVRFVVGEGGTSARCFVAR